MSAVWNGPGDLSPSQVITWRNFVDLQAMNPLGFWKSVMSHFPNMFAPASALIMAVGLVVGCGKHQDQADWWPAEQQRIELSQQLELKNYRFEQTYSHDFEQLESLRRSTIRNVALLKSMSQQRLDLGNQIESLEGRWAEFQESTLRDQRQLAMHKTFEKLTLVSGRTFVNASVASIDDSGVTIRHVDGSARLRYADLDAKQRVFFGMEADRALAAEELEAKDAAAYESWVETRMLALDDKKLKDSDNARRLELTVRQTRAVVAAQLASASAARPLARPATSVGNRSWSYYGYSGYYSNYRTYRPAYRYVYYNNTPSYTCEPFPMRVPPGQVTTPYVRQIVPNYKSFADTTIPSIP